MKYDFLVRSTNLNQAFEPEGSSGGGWGDGITRRSFIKRTGGATVGALVAWNMLVDRVRAEGENNQAGSGGSHFKWWPGNAVFSVPLEVDHDSLVSALRTVLVNNGVTGTWVSSDSALRTHLGWSSGQTTKYDFCQTIAWEEELSKPDGTGEMPRKFRKLSWSYGGNKIIDVVITVTNSGVVCSLPSGNVGMMIFTEGSQPGDVFQLGSYILSPTAGSGIGNTSSVSLIGGPLANGATQWYPSGNTTGEQPGDKSRAKFGTWVKNFAAQPQSVDTVGDWPGNGDGVNSFELLHKTTIYGTIFVKNPSGQIASLPFSPLIETGKNSTLTTTDWRNNRQPVTSNVSLSLPDWRIHVKRPEPSP